MLTALFLLGIIYVFINVIIIGVKAAWGITKILLTLIFWPLILVIMAVSGLMYIALIVLVISVIASFFTRKSL